MAESPRARVAACFERSPVVGVVRTSTHEEAARQARLFIAAGLELIEITFTVPGAIRLVKELLTDRGDAPSPSIGMGTVSDAGRARQAAAAGAEFLISPNVSAEVAREAQRADRFLVMGALTPTEIVSAKALGADLVKVYPLPPVGGAAYLATVRQPLPDIPMLAAGGFGVDDIPAYRAAGAVAFGIGAPLLAADEASTRHLVQRALHLARPEIAA